MSAAASALLGAAVGLGVCLLTDPCLWHWRMRQRGRLRCARCGELLQRVERKHRRAPR